MSEKRRKFDQEFREGAVRIVRETGKPVVQVARDLGINEGTLGNWFAKDRGEQEGTNGLSVEDINELKRLRSENAELRMERDVPSAPWSCGCYPEFGITPTMLRPGLCRVRCGLACRVWDSRPNARHNHSPARTVEPHQPNLP
jgi:transposase